MKALVKFDNKPYCLEIRDVPVPQTGDEDILLKIKAAGICGWDVEMWGHKNAGVLGIASVRVYAYLYMWGSPV